MTLEEKEKIINKLSEIKDIVKEKSQYDEQAAEVYDLILTIIKILFN